MVSAFHYITIYTLFWFLSRTFTSFSDCLSMSIDNNLCCTRIDYFSNTEYQVSITNNITIGLELKMQRAEFAKLAKYFDICRR